MYVLCAVYVCGGVGGGGQPVLICTYSLLSTLYLLFYYYLLLYSSPSPAPAPRLIVNKSCSAPKRDMQHMHMRRIVLRIALHTAFVCYCTHVYVYNNITLSATAHN